MTDYIFEIIVSCITAVAVFFTGLINHIWKTEQQKNITDNNKMAQRLEVLESAPQHCGRGDRYEVRMSDIEKETSQLSHAQDLFCKKLDVLSKEITAMVKDQKEISKQLDKITMWIEFKEKEEKKKEGVELYWF